ncbi:MAG: PilZ domain-containing protein [Thermodesulfobacteriota bacterium]
MLVNAINEKRSTTRFNLTTKVVISNPDRGNVNGTIKNLSATGALIHTGEMAMPIDSECMLSITLTGESSNLVIRDLSAIVIRNDPEGMAVYFPDSMEWLALFYMYKNKLKFELQ